MDKIDRTGFPYKDGRKAGAANKARDGNPFSRAHGEWSDWDTGWIDGYTDIGWSKTPKAMPKPKDGK